MSRGTFHVGPRPAGFGEERCEFDTYSATPTWRGYDPVQWSCKLVAEHDGDHDAHANWRGHFEAAAMRGGPLELEGRHSHGRSSVRFESQGQVDAFCAWLQEHAAVAFS